MNIRTRIVESSGKDALKELRASLPASGNTKLVATLAGHGRTVIRQRTAAGKGAGNQPFVAYSKKPYYAPIDRRKPGYPRPTGGRSKTPSGRQMKSVYYADGYGQYKAAIGRGSTPQLSVSGAMLGAIVFSTPSARLAVLYFSSREQAGKAHGHQYGTTVPKRVFFDLSDFTSGAQLEKAAIVYLRDAVKAAKLERARRAA